ncbi:unnamed protein product [Absidia cylindrospora]
MTASRNEDSLVYHIISFLVVWVDFIARIYLRVKATFDAVVYIAQSPTQQKYYSRRPHYQHHQRNQSIADHHISSNPIHVGPKFTPSSAIPIQHLPTEVFQLVLLNGTKNDLFHCTMVCQRWHRLVTPLLWKDPSFPLSSLPVVGNAHPSSLSYDTIPSTSSRRTHHHRRRQFTSSSAPPLSRDGKDLPKIIPSLRLPKYGHAIQTLRLGSISQQLTDDLLLYITQMCPSLTALDLSHCQHITSLGYQHLARSQCASSLIQLNLTTGVHLTDASLVSLSMKCDSLEIIHLAGCHRITQTGVRSLVTKSQQTLRYINIKDCVKVSGHILQDLAALCGPRLLGVDATRICSILHSDIEILVRHCPYLEQLYIGQNKSPLLRQLLYRIRKEQRQEPWVLPSTNKKSPSTSLSASLLQQRQLSRSKSSYLSSKPDALDSLLDMLQQNNMNPINAANTPTSRQRSHRSRHLSQPVWQYNNDGTTTNSGQLNAIHHRHNNRQNTSVSQQQATDQVSIATVELIMKHLTHLKAVDFSHWNCLTDQLIRRLRQHHGHAIQFIGLEGCRMVTQTSSSLVPGPCDS